MTPTQTFDPRSAWDHARRIEIYRYAKEKGITEIVEAMPKDLMVLRLKALGLPPPPVPQRPIGALIDSRSGDTSPESHHYTGQPQKPVTETVVMDAAAVMERDWQQTQKTPTTMTITEMRQELKRRGIKMKRTDNMAALRAKLDGE